MRCTKAIIPVAGYGTRRLPITKTIEKCMLPLLNRPVIDYIVEDCIKAGITDIYFVVSPGTSQLRDYYRANPILETYLQANNKSHAVSLVTPPQNVQFHFVEQDTYSPDAKYGTAVPVWLCKEYVEPDEHVLVLMGDDFLHNADGSSETAHLVAAAKTGGSALLGVEIPKEQVVNYGVIVMQADPEGSLRFEYIQERPTVETAKSNLINVSKYAFDSAFFGYLDRVMEAPQEDEYKITDAINAYVADGHLLEVVPAKGTYLDSGTTESWLAANNYLASVAQ